MRRAQLVSLTILFAVILLCVTVLSILCVSTARADLAVTENYEAHVTALSRCETEGQRWLAAVDGALAEYGSQLTQDELPEGCTLEGKEISTVLSADGITLTIRLEILSGETSRYRILQWTRQTLWTPEQAFHLW